MKLLSGINIQWPWSQYLIDGQKTVETRSYPIPEKYLNKELAIIETPGPKGKKEAGIVKARIIGTITFSASFKYKNKKDWMADRNRHLVNINDALFNYDNQKEKWGWVVFRTHKLKRPVPPPSSRGIVFSLNCQIPNI